MTDKIHPFEEHGLGLAPFHAYGYYRDVGPKQVGMFQVGSPGQPMGSCAYCGQGIAICVQIQSSDGKKFVVGIDCADKCFDESNKRLSQVQRIRAQIARDAREAKAAERRAKREAEYQAKLEEERKRNGGLTDWEVKENLKKAEQAKQRQLWSVTNAWLIDRIRGTPGDFVRSMIEKLECSPIDGLSPRCVDILKDIYAKTFGRRGSKAYNAAYDEFETHATT